MKAVLFDIENLFPATVMEEVADLIREMKDYDLTEPEPGYFHCISRQPDFHVEISVKSEGMAVAKCHCAPFRKNKQCYHALAALILLRDQILRQRKRRSKSKQDSVLMDEVLQKLKVTDLKTFISSFAHSHGVFRAEFLAHYLHLMRRPDYQALLMDITPIDKYGNIQLKRNNLKTVRNIISILLRQAQGFLKEKALEETLQIIQAVLHHLHRLIIKVPQFREQLSTELRLALKLYDTLCHQSMAPRLQLTLINLALDISHREGYTFLSHTKPLLLSAEPFILEEKVRQTAFQLASNRMLTDIDHQRTWGSMLVRWMRLWKLTPAGKELKQVLKKLYPTFLLDFSRQGENEDVIYTYKQLDTTDYPIEVVKEILQATLKAARQYGDRNLWEDIAYQLSVQFLDQQAWDWLHEINVLKANNALSILKEKLAPGIERDADHLVLHGWYVTGNTQDLLERLQHVSDMTILMQYDGLLLEDHREAIENLYIHYIQEMREKYGGVVARQKLNNIFSHLKSIDLYPSIADKLKNIDKKNKEMSTKKPNSIRGFVFDLDGVIVDTAIHHFHAWKKIMKQLGVEIQDEDDDHTRGASRMESLEYLIGRYGIKMTQEEKEMWASRKNNFYLEAIEQITPDDLLPGASDFLKASRQSGLLLALGSASKNARGVLEKLEIEDQFDAILDGNDAKESKPHPEIFIKASQALHLDPAEVVVFEDAAKGVQSAIAAGCKVVGLGDPKTLRAADIVFSGLDQTSPSQILDQLS